MMVHGLKDGDFCLHGLFCGLFSGLPGGLFAAVFMVCAGQAGLKNNQRRLLPVAAAKIQRQAGNSALRGEKAV